jgi:hypothetical protein
MDGWATLAVDASTRVRACELATEAAIAEASMAAVGFTAAVAVFMEGVVGSTEEEVAEVFTEEVAGSMVGDGNNYGPWSGELQDGERFV